MEINKKIKSIVITYEDEECVRLSGKQAQAYQNTILHYIYAYQLAVSSGLLSNEKQHALDLLSSIDYEVIRNGLRPDQIVYK